MSPSSSPEEPALHVSIRAPSAGSSRDGTEAGWFDEIAAFLGPAYLRNAFTKGTEQEVAFLVDALELGPGSRVLDVGCGPGRHALALARMGVAVVGVDRSPDFIQLARAAAAAEELPAAFVELDVRELDIEAEFDAVICLCQGGFGLLGGRDEPEVFSRIARAVRPGGRLALSAFSAAFVVRFLEDGEEFDPATGVLHERATVRDGDGGEREYDLWTTCFTPRELELLARTGGLTVDGVYGVTSGGYGRREPTLEHPELLLLARRSTFRSTLTACTLVRRPHPRPLTRAWEIRGSARVVIIRSRSKVVGSGRDGGGH